jgi:hypothetical protein
VHITLGVPRHKDYPEKWPPGICEILQKLAT